MINFFKLNVRCSNVRRGKSRVVCVILKLIISIHYDSIRPA